MTDDSRPLITTTSKDETVGTEPHPFLFAAVPAVNGSVCAEEVRRT